MQTNHSRTRRNRTVVIVTHNHEATIHDCLSALRGEGVLVVDNASSDATVDIASRFRSYTRVIRNRVNRGFAAAANQGMHAVAGADVVLMNPDVVVRPGLLGQLEATAYSQCAGLVAPLLVYPDGAAQESARRFPTIYHLLGRRTVLGRTEVGRRWQASALPSACRDAVCPVDWTIGALMYLPRASIDIIGGFDEQFFLYGEDADLCARLWSAGAPVLLDSRSVATHWYGRASRHTFNLLRPATRHHWMSILRLARRYPHHFFLNRPLVPLGPSWHESTGFDERHRPIRGRSR